MKDLIIISTTSDDRSKLDEIAKTLVNENLAACVQINGPITSHYSWQGRIESSTEWSCLIKTKSSLWEAVEARIAELHNYQTPQILAIPVANVSKAYGEWVELQTRN